ncbi:hypothetical protein CDAR_603131 [Caerostris darwini]|uniref:Uncharacterized protein n=1 Tax=Caerostris darwini TaxID=1538125 RepID=A0AAV4W7R6_9ARAC|nr:hypothetical protein CDAR_603131 [Caerostris darwini]
MKKRKEWQSPIKILPEGTASPQLRSVGCSLRPHRRFHPRSPNWKGLHSPRYGVKMKKRKEWQSPIKILPSPQLRSVGCSLRPHRRFHIPSTKTKIGGMFVEAPPTFPT